MNKLKEAIKDLGLIELTLIFGSIIFRIFLVVIAIGYLAEKGIVTWMIRFVTITGVIYLIASSNIIVATRLYNAKKKLSRVTSPNSRFKKFQKGTNLKT